MVWWSGLFYVRWQSVNVSVWIPAEPTVPED